MTTGDVPFRAATPIGIVSRHLSDEPVLPSSRRADGTIPRELDDLILRGLAKVRELRPSTAAIFRDELNRILTDGMARRAFADAQTLMLGSGSMTATRLPRATTPAATPIMPLPPARTSRKPLAIGLGGAALVLLVAVVISRRFLGPLTAAAPGAAALAGPAAVPAPPAPPPAAAAPVAEAARPIAPAAPGIPALAGPPPAVPAGRDRLARRKAPAPRSSGHPARAPGGPAPTGEPDDATPSPAVAAAPASPQPAAADSTTDEKAALASPSRGTRDAIVEGEKLLAQGDAAQACRKGEEAKRATPKAAPVYKFLGKCYMRAGSAPLAKENYRHYLELAPNAPDAVFIESMIK